MTPEQTAIDRFVEQGESQDGRDERSVESSDTAEGATSTELFRLADDPFVNEAAAEIGRQLANEGLVKISQTAIRTAPGADIGAVATLIEQIFEETLASTHRRTAVAHLVNGAVAEVGQGSDDDRWIPTPDTYFPERGDEDLTTYSDDRVDVETLEAHGLPADKIEYIDDESSSLYQRSPTFVGHPSGHKFDFQVSRYERYLEAYLASITGEFEPNDHACMLCGAREMPTTKDIEGEDLEFNQSFDIRSTASAVSRPLGMGSRKTAHSGRCAACLVAGFYYTLMPKVVRFKDRETCGGEFPLAVYRIFTPRGDLEELSDIRGDFAQDLLRCIDEPTVNDRARRSTLPATSTKSRGLQTLQFYESVLRHANTAREQDYYQFTVEHRPTALISYTSARKKSGNPIRDIREVESIDPDEWAYEAVRKRSLSRGAEGTLKEYWPFKDLLDWYAGIEEWYSRRGQEGPVAALDDIAYGVLEQNLKRLARGHFEITKALEQEQGINAPYVLSIRRASDYFTTIMQQVASDTTDRIGDEAIESIKRVASSVGETFYERDDISVLIGLQNANTPDEFLQAFEKASMQAQKKASTDEAGTGSWSGQNDVAMVLQLINDSETFDPAKRMFVIHASLSAQYMNAQRGSEDGE